MITPVYGQSARVCTFVAANIPGCEAGFGNAQGIGFERDGVLVAGVVYHNWEPNARVIELSAASTDRAWLNKTNLMRVFEYPFSQIDCRMCVARISEHNKRARRVWLALGSSGYRIPEMRGPNEAEIIYTLKAETWRTGKFKEKQNG